MTLKQVDTENSQKDGGGRSVYLCKDKYRKSLK